MTTESSASPSMESKASSKSAITDDHRGKIAT